mgnify:CR=1 FL=1
MMVSTVPIFSLNPCQSLKYVCYFPLNHALRRISIFVSDLLHSCSCCLVVASAAFHIPDHLLGPFVPAYHFLCTPSLLWQMQCEFFSKSGGGLVEYHAPAPPPICSDVSIAKKMVSQEYKKWATTKQDNGKTHVHLGTFDLSCWMIHREPRA